MKWVARASSVRFGKLLPSTASSLSPGWRCAAAGVPDSTAPTWPLNSFRLSETAKRITKASRRFIAGPAPMTTIRFQTGWL